MKKIYTFKSFLNEQKEIGSGEFADFDNDNGEEFWGNFGAGVLPYCSETKRFLINYRSKYVNEPHCWGIWGGKIDDEEHVEMAVKREFEEESEYTGDIELISAYVFKNPNGSFKYYNYIGIIPEEFTPRLNWESEDFKWVTVDELFSHENKHFGLDGLLNDSATKNIIKEL